MFVMLVALIGFGICANAQDVILKKDASEIKAKVLEITGEQVKYKDFDYQDGPTRNINISEVFMITYQNGQKEVFNKPAEVKEKTEMQLQSTDNRQSTNYQSNENYALIHLYRLGNFIGSAVSFDIDLDGKSIWRCKNDRKKTVKVTKEGVATLHAKTEAETHLTIDVEFGKEYYVECSIAPGVMVGRPALTLQHESVGEPMFNKIKKKKDDTE